MAAAVPLIEVADDADPSRIRRPHGKGDAVDAIDAPRMRAEPLEDTAVAALGHEVDVHVAEDLRKAVGVFRLPHRRSGGEAKPVGERRLTVGDEAGEEAGFVKRLKGGNDLAAHRIEGRDGLCAWPKDADRHRNVAAAMRPEDRERIVISALDERFHGSVVGTPSGFGLRACYHALLGVSPRMSRSPRSGIESHVGRLADS